MRTSTVRGRSSPSRWISPFCRVRNSLACTASGNSPTSSRNSVPLLAASKRPGRSVSAPENAPLAWPNSSLSASDSGRAAQFTCTSGLPRRRDWRCTRCANNSLPTPVSPSSRMGSSESATTSISCSRRAMASLCPRISLSSASALSAGSAPRATRSARVSASRRVTRRAASTSTIMSRRSDCASASKVPTSSASSVSTPQGWPSICRLVPMQSCTGSGSPAMPLISPS